MSYLSMKSEALIIIIYLAEILFLTVNAGKCSVYPLYPFGIERLDSALYTGDDANNPYLVADRPFNYYGKNFTSFHACINGLLSFEGAIYTYDPDQSPRDQPYVAIFWADAVLSGRIGRMYFRNVNTAIEKDVIQMVEDDSIALGEFMTPDLVLIATWDRVSEFSSPYLVNTYQAVVASSGSRTILILNYGKVTWIAQGDNVGLGFNKGRDDVWVHYPISQTHEMINLDHYSTIGIPGRIVTRVDGDIQLPELSQSVCTRCNINRDTGRVETFDDVDLYANGTARTYLLSKLSQGNQTDQLNQCKYMLRATTDEHNRISWMTFSVGVHPTNQSKYNINFEFSRNEPDIILVRGPGPKRIIETFPYIEHIQDNGQDLVVRIDQLSSGWLFRSDNCSYTLIYRRNSYNQEIRFSLGSDYVGKTIGLCQNYNDDSSDDNMDCSPEPQATDPSTVALTCSCPISSHNCNEALQNL